MPQQEIFALLPCGFLAGGRTGKVSASFGTVGVFHLLAIVALMDTAILLTGEQERGCHGNHTPSIFLLTHNACHYTTEDLLFLVAHFDKTRSDFSVLFPLDLLHMNTHGLFLLVNLPTQFSVNPNPLLMIPVYLLLHRLRQLAEQAQGTRKQNASWLLWCIRM